jgi:hypothetical protein
MLMSRLIRSNDPTARADLVQNSVVDPFALPSEVVPGQKPEVVSWEVEYSRKPNLETLFQAWFTPVLAKHSKSFSLIDCISVGVDRMQRNFEPMRKQVEAWQKSELTDVTAKVVIYEAA